MTFLNPSAGYWAFLAVPIVIFYVLKVTVRLIPVSTVMFWDEVLEERTSRSLWHKFRHLSSLLVQLLLLALLIFAFADPSWRTSDSQKRRVVVVLDQSGSMKAESDGQIRFDVARDRVLELIDGLRPEDELALITTGGQPTLISGFTNHRQSLRNAVQKIRPTDGAARLAKALTLAKRLTSSAAGTQIAVITDGCSTVETEFLNDESVVWMPVGESQENAAISGFQVRRSLVDPTGYQVLMQLKNFSDQPLNSTVDLSLNGQLLDVVNVNLPANDVVTRVIEKVSVDGGVLMADLVSDDSHSADNMAYGVLPDARRMPVTLVNSQNWFLRQVLQANQTVQLTESATADDLQDGVIVFDGAIPDTLPTGNIFIVNPATSSGLWQIDGRLQSPLVGQVDTDSDVLRHVNLQNVLIPEAVKLKPLGDHETLIESVDGSPLLVRFSRAEGDVLVLAIDLEQGDLALRTAFPILLTNALLSFSPDSGGLLEQYEAGSLADVELPDSLVELSRQCGGNLLVSSPTGARQLKQVVDGRLRFGPLNEAGVWLVTRPLTDEEQAAVDDGKAPTIDGPFLRLVCGRPAEEGELRTGDSLPTNGQLLQGGVANRPIWFWVTLFAVGLLVTEWWLYHRRRIS